MFEAHWIKADDDSSWVEGEYKTIQTTEIMQLPGGVVIKTSRADFLKNGRPATSSCALVFVPYVTVQVVEGHVMFGSTAAEMSATIGEAMADAINKKLKKFGL